MGGRQVLGAALAALGLISIVVGAVQLVVDDEGGSVAARPSPSIEPTGSPTPTGSPSAEPTEEPAETPEEFYAALSAAIVGGNQRFLITRLHPFTLERYGARQCRTYLLGLQVPGWELEVLSLEGEGPFVYETDGLQRDVEGATTVRIRFTEDGSTFTETDGHIVLVGNRYRWFTDCGTPVAGAL